MSFVNLLETEMVTLKMTGKQKEVFEKQLSEGASLVEGATTPIIQVGDLQFEITEDGNLKCVEGG